MELHKIGSWLFWGSQLAILNEPVPFWLDPWKSRQSQFFSIWTIYWIWEIPYTIYVNTLMYHCNDCCNMTVSFLLSYCRKSREWPDNIFRCGGAVIYSYLWNCCRCVNWILDYYLISYITRFTLRFCLGGGQHSTLVPPFFFWIEKLAFVHIMCFSAFIYPCTNFISFFR